MSDGIESQHLRRLMVRAREAREARMSETRQWTCNCALHAGLCTCGKRPETMTDDVSKPALGDGVASLPAWPEDVVPTIRAMRQWDLQERRAALARMEALKEYAQHTGDCDALRDDIYRLRGCTCGLDALLAACERREGER